MGHYCILHSPIGNLYLEANENALTGLWIENQKHFPSGLSARSGENPNHPVLQKAGHWLALYFAGKRPDPLQIPLEPIGTSFQTQVWSLLLGIPYGATVTYGQLAKQLGKPGASQAVGGAVGRNPIGIIVPCHRVIGAGGALTGYAGGLDAKIYLLNHENE